VSAALASLTGCNVKRPSWPTIRATPTGR